MGEEQADKENGQQAVEQTAPVQDAVPAVEQTAAEEVNGDAGLQKVAEEKQEPATGDILAEIASEAETYRRRFGRDLLRDMHTYVDSVNLMRALNGNQALQAALNGMEKYISVLDTLPYKTADLIGEEAEEIPSEGETKKAENKNDAVKAKKVFDIDKLVNR